MDAAFCECRRHHFGSWRLAPARRTCSERVRDSLCRGRQVICIGDAAHGMEPTLGQGACQGLEDAAILSELATRLKPSEILDAFERLRLSRLQTIMARSSFWTHAAHGPLILQKLVRTITRLTPARVLDRSMEAIHQMSVYDR